MALQVLRSPVLPFAAVVAASLSSFRGSNALAAAIAIYLVRSLWNWWASLTIVVNDARYKGAFGAKPTAAPRRLASAGNQGPGRAKELTPGVDSTAEAANPETASPEDANASPSGLAAGEEWAPFYPSLPFGKAQGPPIDGADCAPYWKECEASLFEIRNMRYKQTREKVPSENALYDCVGMDLIRDKSRIDALIDRLPGDGHLPAGHPSSVPWDPAWGIPRVFIVNCQLPYKAGSVFGAHPEDDGGLSVFSYFVLSRACCEQLAAGEMTPALGLLRRFVEDGVSTKAGISFKVIGRVENIETFDIPQSFHKFNNKPVLLTGSAKVLLNRLPEAIEIDYDVRNWVFPARSALERYAYLAREAELEIAYLVEGKTDDELPEQVLGCFKVSDMDIFAAMWHSLM